LPVDSFLLFLAVGLLASILASNPSAANSSIIQKELDERDIPLSEYQRLMIDQGLYLISVKENLEADLGDKISEINELVMMEYQRIFEEESEENRLSMCEDLLDMRTDVTGAFFKLHWLIDQNRFWEAEALGAGLVSMLNPLLPEYQDYSEYLELLPMIEQLRVSENGQLTITDQNELIELLDPSKPNTYGLVLEMLTTYSGFEHHEVLEYSSYVGQLRSSKKSNIPNNTGIRLFPNPAHDFVTIVYDQVTLSSHASFELVDAQGVIVMSHMLLQDKREHIIPLQRLASGHYTARIKDQDKINFNQILIVE